MEIRRLGPDDVDVGFVTGVEMTHPDKGTEMFLYELSVARLLRHVGRHRARQRRGPVHLPRRRSYTPGILGHLDLDVRPQQERTED
jgi:hypothetical protein